MRILYILLFFPCFASAQEEVLAAFRDTTTSPGCSPSDPVAELGTADQTYAWGSSISSGSNSYSSTSWDRSNPAVFKATLNMKSYTDGGIQDLGGGGIGLGAGFKTQSGVNGGNPFFYLHAGDGASPPNETDVAYVTIDAATYFPLNTDVDVVWEIQTGNLTSDTGYVRVWVDNELVAGDTTSNFSDLESRSWSGGAGGGWGAGINNFGIYQVSGVADLNNSPTLEYWHDALIRDWEECVNPTPPVSIECDSYVANSALFQGVYDKAVTEGFTLPTCAQCAKLDTFASQSAVSEIIDSTEFLFVYYATEDMGRINWADTSELGTYNGITFTEEEGILASSVNGYFDSGFRFPDDAVYADSINYGIGVFLPGGTTSWSPNQQWLMGASEFGNSKMLYISDIVNPDLRFSGPTNNFLLFSTPADSALACGYIAGLGSNNLTTAIGSQSLISTEATPEGYNSTMKTIYIANLNDGSPNSGYTDGNLGAAIFCTGYGLSSYRTSLDTALKQLFSP